MIHPSLAELTDKIRLLPAMPAIALDVIRSLQDSDLDVDALARRISQDQAIAARVLRVANSPFYGLQKQIGSIHDAIVVLGLSTVRSLVLAASMITRLPGGDAGGFSQSAFWRHGLGTAAAAESLARVLQRPPELMFIAGLLHDIGRLAMVSLYPDTFAALREQAIREDRPLGLLETDCFGFDHAEAGASLTALWNFPPAIVDAIGRHHTPGGTPPGSLVGIIHYADAIARALELDGEADGQVPHLDQTTIDGLGVSWEQLNSVLEETQSRFESCRLMLG